MIDDAHSTLQGLISVLEARAHQEGFCADLAWQLALDHDRWGLGEEAETARQSARQGRVNALLLSSRAASLRLHLPKSDGAEVEPGRLGRSSL